MERLLLAIWNGPFYVGPLTRPISLGDAIMKVLETLWRLAVICVSGIAAILAWLSFQDHRDRRERERLIEQTSISAAMDAATCTVDYPIKVIVTNRTGQRLTDVSYEVIITDPASGDNVAPSHFQFLHTKQGIPAGRGVRICLTPFWTDYGVASDMARLTPEMTVSAKVNYVTPEA